MKNFASLLPDSRKYYLSEFNLYDGECFITFNIIDVSVNRNEITVAVTNRGKISVVTYDLHSVKNGLYFEYGVMCEKIYLDDFEEVAA